MVDRGHLTERVCDLWGCKRPATTPITVQVPDAEPKHLSVCDHHLTMIRDAAA